MNRYIKYGVKKLLCKRWCRTYEKQWKLNIKEWLKIVQNIKFTFFKQI
jgi:hypothetical protein